MELPRVELPGVEDKGRVKVKALVLRGGAKGRPKTPWRGSCGLSNRLVHGAKRRRREHSAAVKLAMSKDLQAMLASSSSVEQWKAEARVKYDLKMYQLQRIMAQEEEWRSRVQALGVGLETRHTAKKRGRVGAANAGLQRGAKGARAPGGGRKDEFSHIKVRVKRWLSQQRSRCHYVDCQDLVDCFLDEAMAEAKEGRKELAKRAARAETACTGEQRSLEAVEDDHSGRWYLHRSLSAGDWSHTVVPGYDGLEEVTRVEGMETGALQAWIEALEARVHKLESSVEYRRTYAKALLQGVAFCSHRGSRPCPWRRRRPG